MSSSFFSRDTFVVEQHRKFFELRNQYRIFDVDGAEIGTIEQVKQSAFAILARFGTDLDAMLPTTLELKDATGQPVLEMHKTVPQNFSTRVSSSPVWIRFPPADQPRLNWPDVKVMRWAYRSSPRAIGRCSRW